MDETIKEIVQTYKDVRGGLIPALHALQAAYGNHLPEGALTELATGLNIPLCRIYGAVTFYTMFSTTPRGKNIIRVCESPPCHLMGAQNIIGVLEDELGIRIGETTRDGLFTLEMTSCIGACDRAPAMMINEEVYGDLTRGRIVEVLKKFRRQ
jgi:NADH-quinone oxidoreductase E subunit